MEDGKPNIPHEIYEAWAISLEVPKISSLKSEIKRSRVYNFSKYNVFF